MSTFAQPQKSRLPGHVSDIQKPFEGIGKSMFAQPQKVAFEGLANVGHVPGLRSHFEGLHKRRHLHSPSKWRNSEYGLITLQFLENLWGAQGSDTKTYPGRNNATNQARDFLNPGCEIGRRE